MSDLTVHQKLIAPLAALVTAGQVAYENVPFIPTKGTAWLRETFGPNPTRQIALGDDGYNRHHGVFLVDVFTPVGAGFYAAETLADSVKTAYKRGTVLGSTVHCDRTYRSTARADGEWWMVPVTVEYRADLAP